MDKFLDIYWAESLSSLQRIPRILGLFRFNLYKTTGSPKQTSISALLIFPFAN